MSDQGSWNAFLSHPASGAECEISGEGGTSAGQNSGCEISEEGGTLVGHNSGCEISGEGGTSAGQNSGCEISGEGGTSQGGLSACARCRDPSPWWHGARIAIWSNSIRIPQEDTWRAPLSGLPQGEAHGTRDHHTRAIAYPIRICCSNEKDSLPQPTRHSDGVSGRSVPCHGFQKTLLNIEFLWWSKSYQNTKT